MGKAFLKTVITLLAIAVNTSVLAQMPWELPDDPLADLVRNGIVIQLNTDEKALLEKLGQPRQINRTKVKNRYYDFDDIVVTYTYQGLDISYYHHMHPKHGWKGIASIEVTSNEHQIKHGIYIGMPFSEIEKKVGALLITKWESGGYLHISYQPWDAVHQQIVFVIKDNILKKFVWSDWP